MSMERVTVTSKADYYSSSYPPATFVPDTQHPNSLAGGKGTMVSSLSYASIGFNLHSMDLVPLRGRGRAYTRRLGKVSPLSPEYSGWLCNNNPSTIPSQSVSAIRVARQSHKDLVRWFKPESPETAN